MTCMLVAILIALLVVMILLLLFFMATTAWQAKISEQLQQIHNLIANQK